MTEEILRAAGRDVALFRSDLSAIVAALAPTPRHPPDPDPAVAAPIRARP